MKNHTDVLIFHTGIMRHKEQTKTVTELAYAEVISYNRKKFNVNFIVKIGAFLYN